MIRPSLFPDSKLLNFASRPNAQWPGLIHDVPKARAGEGEDPVGGLVISLCNPLSRFLAGMK